MLLARALSTGLIVAAAPTPGLAVIDDGTAGDRYDYVPAAVAELEHGATAGEIMVPMTWAAEKRRADLLRRPAFEHCGASVGDGWLAILEQLVDVIEALPGWRNVRFSQVKEKFGGLRAYVGVEVAGLDELIDAAEEQAKRTCEWCGNHALISDVRDGWYAAMCQGHRELVKQLPWGAPLPPQHLLALPVTG